MNVQQVQIEHARKERIAVGKAIRSKVPRAAHALWSPMPDRIDPIDLLEQSSLNRLQSLIPIRYGRMLSSPFAFLRGSAIIMSHDLATTPVPIFMFRYVAMLTSAILEHMQPPNVILYLG